MISRRESLRRLAAGTGVAATSALWLGQASATVFMDVGEAQKLLLSAATTFAPLALLLDAAQIERIAAASQTRVPRSFAPRGWVGLDAGGKRVGWVVTDHVIGKYEFIDFAAGFDAQGAATGVEVLVYRESHGAEIRNTAWRNQFAGAKGPAQLRFNDEVRNISGATLSCQHLTEGVQRLSALVQGLAQG